MKTLLIKPMLAAMIFTGQTIEHSPSEFLPVFNYSPGEIERRIARTSRVTEARSELGTERFDIDSRVNLAATPQWTQHECWYEGRFPNEERVCGDITYYGVSGTKFRPGHVSDYLGRFQVNGDRRSVEIETVAKTAKQEYEVEVPKSLPGSIVDLSAKLVDVDISGSSGRYTMLYVLLTENPRAKINAQTHVGVSVSQPSIRFEKINGEIPRIPSVFDDIWEDAAFDIFQRQTNDGDVEYFERFFALNWPRIFSDRNNQYLEFIFSTLRSPPNYRDAEARLKFVEQIPEGDPLITEQSEHDSYTIVERNYQFMVYSGHPKATAMDLLKLLVKKGAKVVRKGSSSDLVTDIKYYDLKRVTDPELREMLFKAAKEEGIVPISR